MRSASYTTADRQEVCSLVRQPNARLGRAGDTKQLELPAPELTAAQAAPVRVKALAPAQAPHARASFSAKLP